MKALLFYYTEGKQYYPEVRPVHNDMPEEYLIVKYLRTKKK